MAEFDGLRRPPVQAKVTADAGISGHLHDLVTDGDVDIGAVTRLLVAMKENSRPVKPERLGIIGKEHLLKTLVARGATPDGCEYQKMTGVGDDGLPFVAEIGFGVKPKEGETRDLIIGLNWSPVFKIPSGHIAEALQSCKVNYYDPVVLAIHLACPRFPFVDHGKGAISDE